MVWEEWVSRGLSVDELWASDPVEITGVLERVQERDRHHNKLAGMIAAQVVNSSGRARRHVEWHDFFREHAGTPRLSEQAQQRFESRPLVRVGSDTPNRRLST